MPLVRKNAAKLPLQTQDRRYVTTWGGLVLLEALCRRVGLWDQLDEAHFARISSKHFGRRPAQSIVAQLLFSIAQGGGGLSDAANLKDEPLLQRLVGIKHAADEACLQSWLEGQTESGVAELRRLNCTLVRWALAERYPAKTDDERNSIIVVVRRKSWSICTATRSVCDWGLEMAQLGWWTLTVGPFLVDSRWSRDDDTTEDLLQLQQLIGANRDLWKSFDSHLVIDHVPSISAWKEATSSGGFTSWTADPSEYAVEHAFGLTPSSGVRRWLVATPPDPFAQSYGLLYPQGEARNRLPGAVAVSRRKREACAKDSYAYLVVCPTPPLSPEVSFSRHLQGKAAVDQLLDTPNLSSLVQFEGNVRAAYSSIAALAYNLLAVIRLMAEPASKGWTTHETMRAAVMMPAQLSRSGRQATLHLAIPSEWPVAWRAWLSELEFWR